MGAFTRTENEAVVGLASRSACEQGSIVCTCTHHSDLRQVVPPTLTSAFSHPAMKPGACRQQSMCTLQQCSGLNCERGPHLEGALHSVVLAEAAEALAEEHSAHSRVGVDGPVQGADGAPGLVPVDGAARTIGDLISDVALLLADGACAVQLSAPTRGRCRLSEDI